MAPTVFKTGHDILITYIGGSVHGGQVTRRVTVIGLNEKKIHTVDEDGAEISYRWDDLIDAEEVPIVERIQPIILRSLKDYRVSWADPDESGELVDFLSPPGGTIEPGKRELDELADEIALAVSMHI